jgi:hypothetical protein
MLISNHGDTNNLSLGTCNMNRNRLNSTEVNRLHRENLERNLQRRMEAARARGDQALLRMLEAEANYLK